MTLDIGVLNFVLPTFWERRTSWETTFYAPKCL